MSGSCAAQMARRSDRAPSRSQALGGGQGAKVSRTVVASAVAATVLHLDVGLSVSSEVEFCR